MEFLRHITVDRYFCNKKKYLLLFLVGLKMAGQAETCSQISPNCNYCILFDVCSVLTVHNISYKFDNTQRDGLSQKKKHGI